MNRVLCAGMARKSVSTMVTYGLVLILPSLALLYYVARFSVNVVFWDDWEMVPLLQKMTTGTLTFDDLFVQHNEHRILFPRMAMLAISSVTRYNTVAISVFSWAVITGTALLVFHTCQESFSWSSNTKLMLAFLPVSALLFSLRQYEALLWASTCQIYLMIFGVVSAFCFLEMSKKRNLCLVPSVLCAFLASFSFSPGLMVWPVGLVQILISQRKKGSKAMAWSLMGTATAAAYFFSYRMSTQHPTFNYLLANPLNAARYFITIIGAPFSFDDAMAAAIGLVIASVGAFILMYAYRGSLFRKNGVWLSLVLFTLLSSMITTVGRGALGAAEAMASRYTPITVLGIVGLYFLAISVSEKFNSKNMSFGSHALLAFILLGLAISCPAGWLAGQYWKNSMETGANVLLTYRVQSDDNIRRYLYPVPEVVRERAQFLEQNKLSVFSHPMTNTSTSTTAYRESSPPYEWQSRILRHEELSSAAAQYSGLESMIPICWGKSEETSTRQAVSVVLHQIPHNVGTLIGFWKLLSRSS